MDDRRYRQLGGRLQPILVTFRRLHSMGFWVEIVTLIVPGFNDSDSELRQLSEFLAGVSVDIPWHVTAFHQDYKMTSHDDTPPQTLQRAAEFGRRAGLRYIYAGNLPGRVGDLENTRCPHCRELLIERYGYFIRSYRVTSEGTCPSCGAAIAGRWSEKFQGQIASTPFLPRSRRRASPVRN